MKWLWKTAVIRTIGIIRIVENRCAEEKEDLLFAKRALMTFHIHFVDVIILFLFAYKTIILHAQF